MEKPVITFKGKDYPVREQFARGEAQLVALTDRLKTAELAERVDTAVEMVNLLTGIDKGDLNGLKLKPLLELTRETTSKYFMAYGEQSQSEAEAPGKGDGQGPPQA